jgi:bifunctional non-homologous end joining protein LigD
MSLKEYIQKRDFKKTGEPSGNDTARSSHRFVIQKHAASRLHYDFRLEMDGVLKSWAVPKGVPYIKGEKRLAVAVEDHPVSYIDFEGTIPQGQYGGGTVMVWDKGTFTTDVPNPVKELAGGKLHFTLRGTKLNGDWHLVNMHHSNQWLLIKGGEDFKPISKKLDDTSVLSGKSMAQISTNGAHWQSNKTESPKKAPTKKLASRAARPLAFVEPMKAKLMDEPPAAGNWTFEIKFDGFRAEAWKNNSKIGLLSRNKKDFAQKFPEVVDAVSGLDVDDAIIDGEIVALDAKGVSSFQLLQAYELGEKRPPIYFYVFDLLRLNGEDLTGQSLIDRKAKLATILKNQDGIIRYSGSLGSDATKLLKRVQKLGLEGLIGKRAESVYEPGKRSGAWIKLKLRQEQEFVIGGYSDPEGSRLYFGAVLVGVYQGKQLTFCGKVGTGFDAKLLKRLNTQFQGLRQNRCPFSNLPETAGGRHSPRLSAAEMKHCHWLEPKLAGQIKFSEWTRDGKLRQPVFLGLREDKAASDVVREKAP